MAGGNDSSACALMDVRAQTQIAQEATNRQIDGSLPDVQLCQQAITAVADDSTEPSAPSCTASRRAHHRRTRHHHGGTKPNHKLRWWCSAIPGRQAIRFPGRASVSERPVAHRQH